MKTVYPLQTDEIPAMTLRVIKETKRYGRTDNVKTVYPLQTKFAGGIKTKFAGGIKKVFSAWEPWKTLEY